MIFNTSDYKTREDLDVAVRGIRGLDEEVQAKGAYKIYGTADDLKRLHLSEGTMIYGVTVEVNK